MSSQVKIPFQVLLFSTPLSLFIAGFLSSIANARLSHLPLLNSCRSLARCASRCHAIYSFQGHAQRWLISLDDWAELHPDALSIVLPELSSSPPRTRPDRYRILLNSPFALYVMPYIRWCHRDPNGCSRLWLTHHRYHRRHRCPTFDDVTATLMGVRDDVMTGNHYKVQKDYTQHPFVFHSAVCHLHCTSHRGSGVGRTSTRFQLPGHFVWLHSSLPQWTECELPAILPCWSLHLPRTAGAPSFVTEVLRIAISLHFTHDVPDFTLLWFFVTANLDCSVNKPSSNSTFDRRWVVAIKGEVSTCVLAFCTRLCPIYLPRLLCTVRPWMASSPHFCLIRTVDHWDDIID